MKLLCTVWFLCAAWVHSFAQSPTAGESARVVEPEISIQISALSHQEFAVELQISRNTVWYARGVDPVVDKEKHTIAKEQFDEIVRNYNVNFPHPGMLSIAESNHNLLILVNVRSGPHLSTVCLTLNGYKPVAQIDSLLRLVGEIEKLLHLPTGHWTMAMLKCLHSAEIQGRRTTTDKAACISDNTTRDQESDACGRAIDSNLEIKVVNPIDDQKMNLRIDGLELELYGPDREYFRCFLSTVARQEIFYKFFKNFPEDHRYGPGDPIFWVSAIAESANKKRYVRFGYDEFGADAPVGAMKQFIVDLELILQLRAGTLTNPYQAALNYGRAPVILPLHDYSAPGVEIEVQSRRDARGDEALSHLFSCTMMRGNIDINTDTENFVMDLTPLQQQDVIRAFKRRMPLTHEPEITLGRAQLYIEAKASFRATNMLQDGGLYLGVAMQRYTKTKTIRNIGYFLGDLERILKVDKGRFTTAYYSALESVNSRIQHPVCEACP